MVSCQFSYVKFIHVHAGPLFITSHFILVITRLLCFTFSFISPPVSLSLIAATCISLPSCVHFLQIALLCINSLPSLFFCLLIYLISVIAGFCFVTCFVASIFWTLAANLKMCVLSSLWPVSESLFHISPQYTEPTLDWVDSNMEEQLNWSFYFKRKLWTLTLNTLKLCIRGFRKKPWRNPGSLTFALLA